MGKHFLLLNIFLNANSHEDFTVILYSFSWHLFGALYNSHNFVSLNEIKSQKNILNILL